MSNFCKRKKGDMWGCKGLINWERGEIFNMNHLEYAYVTEAKDDNTTHFFATLSFKSGNQVDRAFKTRKEAESFIDDLMGFFSVSFESNEMREE